MDTSEKARAKRSNVFFAEKIRGRSKTGLPKSYHSSKENVYVNNRPRRLRSVDNAFDGYALSRGGCFVRTLDLLRQVFSKTNVTGLT